MSESASRAPVSKRVPSKPLCQKCPTIFLCHKVSLGRPCVTKCPSQTVVSQSAPPTPLRHTLSIRCLCSLKCLSQACESESAPLKPLCYKLFLPKKCVADCPLLLKPLYHQVRLPRFSQSLSLVLVSERVLPKCFNTVTVCSTDVYNKCEGLNLQFDLWR